jgi:hypothetical protein
MKNAILLLTTAILNNVAIAQWNGHSRPNPNASSGLIASDGTNLYCSADGIFKSTDNGTTWNNMTPSETINFKTMVFDGNGNIYATGFGSNVNFAGFIISSADNGQTWSYDTLGLGEHYTAAIYFDEVSNRVFTTHANNPSNNWQMIGLYYKNAGSGLNTSWDNISAYGNNQMVGMTRIGNTMFAIDNTHTIKKSTDNGDTWIQVTASGIGINAVYNGNGDSGHRGLLAVNNTLFVIMSDGLYKSTDNGETFTQSGNGIDVNSQGVPRVSMLYYVGNYLYAGGHGNSSSSQSRIYGK